MITSYEPNNWRDLQTQVGRILEECGLAVEVEHVLALPRGSVEVDVFAVEDTGGRTNTVVVECKRWRTPVPQQVVHAFRTVVAETGANTGYIVSTKGFQSGALNAAESTNISLVTWREFQTEFENAWLRTFARSVVRQIDPLYSFIEPILPRWVSDLDAASAEAFFRLRERYEAFGWTMASFMPFGMRPIPVLPLRDHFPDTPDEASTIPTAILDAAAYREFLELAIDHALAGITAFRALRPI